MAYGRYAAASSTPGPGTTGAGEPMKRNWDASVPISEGGVPTQRDRTLSLGTRCLDYAPDDSP